MDRLEARAKIKAAAWLVVSVLGWRTAIEILKEIAKEIEDEQWR